MLLVLANAAAALPVTFQDSATTSGDTTVTAEWLLLIAPPDSLTGSLAAQQLEQVVFQHVRQAYSDPVTGSEGFLLAPVASEPTSLTGVMAELHATGWSSLYAEGAFAATWNATAALSIDRAGVLPGPTPDARGAPTWASRTSLPVSSHAGVVFMGRDLAMTNVTGTATWLEYHGLAPACSNQCPAPAAREVIQDQGPETETITYVRLTGASTLAVEGPATFLILGAPMTTMSLHGWARLPGAVLAECPWNCAEPEEGTILIQGKLEFHNITYTGDTLQADVGGEIHSIGIDEQPRWSPPPAALATAAAVVLGILAAFLISRELMADPASHPTRATILQALQANDGLGFRELRQHLNLANGKLHYHLFILENAGVVRTVTRGNQRLFLASSTDAASARQAAVLRKKKWRELHDYVQRIIPANRVEVIQRAAIELDTPKSSVAYRLRGIIQAGLLQTDATDTLRKP